MTARRRADGAPPATENEARAVAFVAAAVQGGLDETGLRAAAEAGSAAVRHALGDLPSLPPDVMLTLCRAAEPEVRDSAAQRYDLPQEVATALSADPDVNVRRRLAKHTRHAEVLQRLALDPHPGVRAAVARSRRCSADLLEDLANDTDDSVRSAAVKHPRTSRAARVRAVARGGRAVAAGLAVMDDLPEAALLGWVTPPAPRRVLVAAAGSPSATAAVLDVVERQSTDHPATLIAVCGNPALSPALAAGIAERLRQGGYVNGGHGMALALAANPALSTPGWRALLSLNFFKELMSAGIAARPDLSADDVAHLLRHGDPDVATRVNLLGRDLELPAAALVSALTDQSRLVRDAVLSRSDVTYELVAGLVVGALVRPEPVLRKVVGPGQLRALGVPDEAAAALVRVASSVTGATVSDALTAAAVTLVAPVNRALPPALEPQAAGP